MGSSPWYPGSDEPASFLGTGAELVEVKPGLHVKFCTVTVEALIREDSSGVTRAPDHKEGKSAYGEMWISGRSQRGLIRGLWRKAAPV